MLGAVCVMPMIGFYRRNESEPSGEVPYRGISEKAIGGTKRSIVPPLYWIGAVFFGVVSIALAQTGTLSPLLAFCWLMSIALVFAILNGGWNFPIIDVNRVVFSRSIVYEVIEVGLLMVVAGWMQSQTPSQIPLISPATPLQPYSSMFAVLVVPVVYLFGRGVGGKWTGLFTAGLVAACGWTLALGKSGEVYSAAACIGALYLTALVYAWHSGKRSTYLLSGLLLGAGWLVTPQFGYLALLPPTMLILAALDSRKGLRIVVVNTLILLILAMMVILPAALAPHPPRLSQTDVYASGLSPSVTFLDGLSSSVLMFNLTSDPMPLHGIVNRPAFPPVMGAAFILGLLGWAAKTDGTRRWTTLWLIAALVIGLLPAALLIEPPTRYPDFQQAALALPVAVCIAGYGLTLVAELVIRHAGRMGVIAVGLTFAILVVLITADTRDHYTNVFLPAYEQAAQLFQSIRGG